ncbi:MAG: sigma-70 family RNA polymerase sigma factor [Polyangiaceae bacterium]
MGYSNGQYPQDLRKVVAHAQRLIKVLAEIERGRKDAWFRGRAEELRGAMSLAVADWRSGARDADVAGRLLLSYVDALHRSASKKLRCGVALACCDPDDLITAVAPDEWWSSATFDTTGAGTSQLISEPTVPAEWVDTPEMVARFQEGVSLIETHALSVAGRIGPGCTLDDLRGFGREGLLDAARSFDDSRGVPFERWASMRIRTFMIDGVRSWGAMPLRAHQRLRAPPDNVAPENAAEGRSHRRDSPDGVHAAHWVTLEEHDAVASLAEGAASRGYTPEDVLAGAELASIVRAIVSKLPTLERALIEQCYFSGQTLAQAAATIGVSRSWAHRVHAHAMETLERELRKRDRTGAGGKAWGSKS